MKKYKTRITTPAWTSNGGTRTRKYRKGKVPKISTYRVYK